MIALGFQMSRCQGVRRDAERSMGSGVHEIKGSQSPWIQGCMDGSRHGVLEGVPKSQCGLVSHYWPTGAVGVDGYPGPGGLSK